MEAYENSDWIGATEKFESSLGAYFKADEECDAECDSLLDDDKFSEFHRKVAEAKFKEEARYYMSSECVAFYVDYLFLNLMMVMVMMMLMMMMMIIDWWWMNWLNKWTFQRMKGLDKIERMNKWMCERMNEWLNEWMNACMNPSRSLVEASELQGVLHQETGNSQWGSRGSLPPGSLPLPPVLLLQG